jgi:hypothetical protein
MHGDAPLQGVDALHLGLWPRQAVVRVDSHVQEKEDWGGKQRA